MFFIKKCRCRNCRQQHLMFLNISKRSFVGRNGNYRFYFLPVNHHGDSSCSVAYLQRIVYRSVFVIHTFRQCFRRTCRDFRRPGIRRKTHDNIFLLIGFKVIFISVFRNSQPVITSQLKPRLIEIGRQPFAAVCRDALVHWNEIDRCVIFGTGNQRYGEHKQSCKNKR